MSYPSRRSEDLLRISELPLISGKQSIGAASKTVPGRARSSLSDGRVVNLSGIGHQGISIKSKLLTLVGQAYGFLEEYIAFSIF